MPRLAENSASRLEPRKITMPTGRTSVSLEPEFWREIESFASRHHVTVQDVCREVGTSYKNTPLPSALRCFVVDHLRDRIRRTETC